MDIFYPFERFAQLVTYDRLGIRTNTHLWWAVAFFIYDILKIFVLLVVITQVMSLVTILFPMQKIQQFLTKNKLFWLEYLFASLFGAITPFCTCSSIPLFIWLLKARIPLGVTFAFLITSPLVNEVAIALFLWLFGLKTTLLYVWGGVLLGVVGWWILWQLKLESQVAEFIRKLPENDMQSPDKQNNWQQIRKEATKEWWGITAKVFPYVVVWVGIWAMIHGFIPVWFFASYIGEDNIFAVPLAVLLWVPMYANATSVIPIIQSLIAKGVPLGTWLAFMMATVGLSLPEFLILKKVMKMKLLLLFFGIVTLAIIILGYVYNSIL